MIEICGKLDKSNTSFEFRQFSEFFFLKACEYKR